MKKGYDRDAFLGFFRIIQKKGDHYTFNFRYDFDIDLSSNFCN